MISLHRRALVAAPLGAANASLKEIVHEAGGRLRLAARPAVHIPGLQTAVALVRDVVAIIAPGGADDHYAVAWRPADHGPFPRFTGTLSLTANEQPHLALEGAYMLPDEHVLVQDALLAHRIVQATAGEVLAQLVHQLERRIRSSSANLRQGAP